MKVALEPNTLPVAQSPEAVMLYSKMQVGNLLLPSVLLIHDEGNENSDMYVKI